MLDESIDENGKMGGLWFCSVNLFTNILIIVSINLLIYTRYHTWINFVILLFVTFIAYIIFLLLFHRMIMFNSVGTMTVAFRSGRLWMNLIFVGGTCGLIDFFILGFNFIINPSSAKELQILLKKCNDMDKMNINEFPKNIREKLESYNEFQKEDDNLKKEITQRNINNNEELKLKPKNVGNQNNFNNLNIAENGASFRDKNINLISDLDENIQKSSKKENKYFDNKLIKKRNNYPEIAQSPSIENSNNIFLAKNTSENTNINNNKKTLSSNNNKSNDLIGQNEVIYYNNQEYKGKTKFREDDNHSRSALIPNKKGCVDEINGSLTKQNNNKSIYA